MSTENVEKLLEAGGQDPKIREEYDKTQSKDEFVEKANKDGYKFTIEELNQVLKEYGNSFELSGFPPRRFIWLK
ncbi:MULTISPECIES: Nif11-like leader peptide family natural product precursor [Roseofilum]|uniref:Bacteriocin n=1 Tax=Roseofilum reptotaenium AO1-A TaxID=1925591 RepID=A0A1L9QYB0_9CYAN|nr:MULTISPECIES: Nif11-like leader peptide family natural product precursor [Roseofilum]OJJ27577.1 bacteriocin [Roseofilum reptotaenium AO1-A]HBQ97561.1 bacteriocin [Cyanobacteria bacterium UBA11691]MBP0009297.1 Nif11-like leader peptide family natural product precursor [Roseofilum sp. Belize Diploria]MBP0013680.1 Nif11-like leader peptide family natural product precursor [Roseofilum sp. SID3]MBP0023480.1 Nif11-like leader peptide family natural product precursor [Roseofilum sp. SID2]